MPQNQPPSTYVPGIAEISLEVERNHSRVTLLLLLDQFVLGVRREPGVTHGLDVGRGLQELAHHQSVLLMLLHTDLQGLQTPAKLESCR